MQIDVVTIRKSKAMMNIHMRGYTISVFMLLEHLSWLLRAWLVGGSVGMLSFSFYQIAYDLDILAVKDKVVTPCLHYRCTLPLNN